MTEIVQQLRKATPTDINSLIDIYLACHRSEYRNLIPKQNLENYDQNISNLQKDPSSLSAKFTPQINSGQIFIAEYHSRPKGYITIKAPTPNSIHISAIFVHPKSSGQGIGKLLVKHIISIAKAHNKTTTLLVLQNNLAAQSFYKKLGFTITSENPSEYYGIKKIKMKLDPTN